MAKLPVEVAGHVVSPGSRVEISMPLAELYTHTPMTMPIQVIAGRADGPTVFVSAAIHGDEINGVEIIHRLLRARELNRLRGNLICIPIVNVFGFLNQTRYLPDGRDLNRSFPGSDSGSLTSRVAHIFLNEIAAKCNYGIDLHTAASHRVNLPQVRANLDDEETLRLAENFHVPVVVNSNIPDGSLRQAASDLGVKVLVFEGGERLRFNERVIKAGVHGVITTLRSLGMLPRKAVRADLPKPVLARGTKWVRAHRSGIHRIQAELGARVRRGDVLGTIADPFGSTEEPILSDVAGIVIGRSNLPLVNEGDAVFHIARFEKVGEAEENVLAYRDAIDNADPLLADTEPPTY